MDLHSPHLATALLPAVPEPQRIYYGECSGHPTAAEPMAATARRPVEDAMEAATAPAVVAAGMRVALRQAAAHRPEGARAAERPASPTQSEPASWFSERLPPWRTSSLPAAQTEHSPWRVRHPEGQSAGGLRRLRLAVQEPPSSRRVARDLDKGGLGGLGCLGAWPCRGKGGSTAPAPWRGARPVACPPAPSARRRRAGAAPGPSAVSTVPAHARSARAAETCTSYLPSPSPVGAPTTSSFGTRLSWHPT